MFGVDSVHAFENSIGKCVDLEGGMFATVEEFKKPSSRTWSLKTLVFNQPRIDFSNKPILVPASHYEYHTEFLFVHENSGLSCPASWWRIICSRHDDDD